MLHEEDVTESMTTEACMQSGMVRAAQVKSWAEGAEGSASCIED